MKKSIKTDFVAEWIKGQIASGQWTAGMKIPSQRVLAEKLHVNRSTIVAALDKLKEDGIIVGAHGKGTIVSNNTWSLFASIPVNQPFVPDKKSSLIDLSRGELAEDVFPENYLNDVLSRLSGTIHSLGYEDAGGYAPLREAIANYMTRQGTETSPSSVLIVSGAMQGLQLIASGLLPNRSSVLLEEPSYLHSIHAFQSLGLTLKGVPMDQDGLIPHKLKQVWSRGDHGALYTIPCFHNPTGTLMTETRRREVLQFSQTESMPVIEDDIYRDLWLDAPPPPSLRSMDTQGNVLYIGSLSKTLSPGLRIGWIAGAEPVIRRLSELKQQADYGTSSLSQRVAAEWLSEGLYEHHLDFVRNELGKRRDQAAAALSAHMNNLAEWHIPSGGFFIWLKLKVDLSIEALYAKSVQEGIVFQPGTIYTEGSSKAIRLSYGYASPSDFREGLKRLKQLIMEMAK